MERETQTDRESTLKENFGGKPFFDLFCCYFKLKKMVQVFFNPKEHKCVFWPQPTQKITLGAMVYK